MTPHSRGAFRPGFACRCPREEEGAGNAGCLLHPRSRVQYVHKNTHTSIQVQSEHSDIPRTMALRLMPRSPRRRIRLVTVIGGLTIFARPGWADKISTDLAPATGARTTRFYRTHQHRSSARRLIAHELQRSRPAITIGAPTLTRPSHHRPYVRDDARSPLSWAGTGEVLPLICPTA
jgi:hypothetical protein